MTAVVKLATLAKDLVVAQHFGTTDALDAFLIAWLLPSFAINVLAGSFMSAVVPGYIEARVRAGQESAQRLFSTIMVGAVAVLSFASVCLAVASVYAVPVLASGFGPDKLALTQSLARILAPVLLLGGLATIWGAMLTAGGRFGLYAIAPAVTPLVTIVAVATASRAVGAYSLAAAAVVGSACEAVLLALALRRQGLSVIPRWSGGTPAVRLVAGQYTAMVVGALLMSGTDLVDQAMAAALGPGSVSALAYGSKVVASVLGLGSVAVGTAVFPEVSRLVAGREWVGVRGTLRVYAAMVAAVTLPFTVVVAGLSESIVGVLFGRGAFTPSDVALVGRIQALYVVQVPFYLLGILAARVISSLKANGVLMRGAAVNLALKILLNYVLMSRFGVTGIAASTVVVYAVSCGYLYWSVRRLLREAAGAAS
ncbi:MAG TPA: lipid II flippase MurJ [Thermodesulfobacteriota bacterium]|nr:lipid II flippase MurJ [Thermodesulfobacteriota bacterium]